MNKIEKEREDEIDYDVCSICYEFMGARDVINLSCMHRFCSECFI